MSADILFDNIVITSDEDAADEWAAKTYDLKRKQIDKESVSNFKSHVDIIYDQRYRNDKTLRVQHWHFINQ